MQANAQPKPITTAHVRLLLAILSQNVEVFSQFHLQLTVDHFTETYFKLVYRVLLDFYETTESLPEEVELRVDIDSWLETDEELLEPDEKNKLYEFIDYAYDSRTFESQSPTSDRMREYAFRVIKVLLQRKQAEDLVYSIKSTGNLDMLPAILQTACSDAEVISLSDYNTDRQYTFQTKWDKSEISAISTTGLGFLDKYMSGGTQEGEAYGLLAPYGTCKTTLAVMLWCEAAKACYHETLISDESGVTRKGMSVLVTYEAPLRVELQHRSLMYSAKILGARLQQMGMDGLAALSDDPENPLEYETELFAEAIRNGVFIPERQRISEAIGWLNEHTFCLDFSGSDEQNPNAGSGGIIEIVNRIKKELRARGDEWYVKNVIVDYLGLMIDRDIGSVEERGEDHKSYQQAANEVIRLISKPFHCHTWLFHQLSGSANSMLSPGSNIHHTDAKGSKSFAENLNFAFTIGNLNDDSMGKIACTKHRRSGRESPSIIKVMGEYNTVISPSNYYLDGKGKIIDSDLATAVGASDASDVSDMVEESIMGMPDADE